jgi:hypothetical protein
MVKLPLAEAVDAMLFDMDRIRKKSEKTIFSWGGKDLVGYSDHDVKGASNRDVKAFQLVYKDHVGRLTLEVLGSAVGVLMKGGTNGRSCLVGFFPPEVKSAAPN